MSDNLELSYQTFWGDSERKDLLPPRNITVEKEDHGGNTPIEVEIDTDKLQELMKLEGVRDGIPIQIVLRDNRGVFRRGQDLGRKQGGDESNGKSILDGVRLGQFRSRNGEGKVTINIGSIYDSVVGFMSRDPEEVLAKFAALTSTILAHEVGHARQPKGIKAGGNTQTYLKVVGGTFVLIDAGRRFALPWLGAAEVAVIPAEFAAAEAVGKKLYYERIPGERFANEYARVSRDQWSDVVQVRIKDEQQLERDIKEKSILKKIMK